MNARSLRRLATDHGALHSQDLPPNYLFSPDAPDNDDLTHLDILLAGPTHTPFAAGVFRLHLTIPPTYPQQPPTAHFRTPIFHPNVDPQTGGVCVETLKRDWDAKLTLRDILLVIQCLLIQPNPDSALNAEAGALLQSDFESFKRRAVLMTSIHAVVPRAWREAVREAQHRGQEVETVEEEVEAEVRDVQVQARERTEPVPPTRRRVPTARQRGTAKARRIEGSPSGASRRPRQQHSGSSNPFLSCSGEEDVFGDPVPPTKESMPQEQSSSIGIFEDDSMTDANQENDESRSPSKSKAPRLATPRRPAGAAVPLGELTMEEADDTEDDSDMEPEYPPSPRKSPTKSILRHRQQQPPPLERAESSRDATRRDPNLTPPNLTTQPLAQDSPFASFATDRPATPSPRKARAQHPRTPPGSNRPATRGGLFGILTPRQGAGIVKTRSPSSSEKKRQHSQRRAELEARLWKSCGGDIRRWNQGDFDGEPFVKKGGRW